LTVIAALAVNPGMTMAGGPPAEAPAAAASRSGALMVESDPVGAAVYVDGQLAGRTPLRVAGLTTGDHRVRMVKDGYLENARLVSVSAETRTVRVPLTRDAGAKPPLAAQLGGGGGATSGGGSKLPLILAVAGGGAVAAILIAKKGSSSSTPANQPPTAGSFTVSPTTAILNTVTTFTATGASDPEGDALSYSWNFGDNTALGTGATTTHTYTTAATFPVTLTVTATGGSASTGPTNLVVKNLNATWTGQLVCCPSTTFNTSVILSQSGTNLTGSFSDGNSGDAGPVTGSVNPTTRQVTFSVAPAYASGGTYTFVGSLNAAATTLTGVANNDSGTPVGPNSPWTMTRP